MWSTSQGQKSSCYTTKAFFPFKGGFHLGLQLGRWSCSSEGFLHHFTINSKFVCCDCNMKRNVAFPLILFAVLKWDDCLSVQVPFKLPVQIPVQLLLELEENWINQNVNELEFEYLECRWNDPRMTTFLYDNHTYQLTRHIYLEL